jgi:hypothetical protein
VAAAYIGLVEHLKLASDARDTIERTSAASALLLASASLKNSTVSRKPVERLPAKPASPAAALSSPDVALPKVKTPLPMPRPAETTRPPSFPDIEDMPAPVRRRKTPAHQIPVAAVAAAIPAAQPPAPAPPERQAGVKLSGGLGAVWFLLAVVGGVVLSRVQLPEWAISAIVGVAVGAVAVLLMRNVPGANEEVTTATPRSGPNGRGGKGKQGSGLRRRLKVKSSPDLNQN